MVGLRPKFKKLFFSLDKLKKSVLIKLMPKKLKSFVLVNRLNGEDFHVWSFSREGAIRGAMERWKISKRDVGIVQLNAKISKFGPCECWEKSCKGGHKEKARCDRQASQILYRVDMVDVSGTAFCEECAADAMESGLFSNEKNFYS